MKVLCAALLLAGCAQVPQQRGGPHPTIVSLNPCSDAILAEVADPAQLLAISHYSHSPHASSMPLAKARRFRSIDGTVEEVLALDPDVVVGDPFVAPATRAAFARLGVRVETVGIASTPAESKAQVRQLAALAGHPERGELLVGRIDAALARSRRPGAVAALLWQEGGLVGGEGSLAAAMLAHTGFANHAAARGLGQGAYLPLEQVLADPPRVILAAGAERMLAHPVLRELGGVRYERLEPSLLYCGGPTIPRLAARLAAVQDALAKPLATHPPARAGEGEE